MARGRRAGFKMSDEHKAALQAGRSIENKTHFKLGNKWRVCSTDERNWTLQKNSGKDASGDIIWISKYFYSSLNSLLRATATMAVNQELKVQGDVGNLASLAKQIEAAETKVLDELKGQIPKTISVG